LNPALLDGHERKLKGPGNDEGEDKVGDERMFLDPSGLGRTSCLRSSGQPQTVYCVSSPP
jgi:hypothetical protein